MGDTSSSEARSRTIQLMPSIVHCQWYNERESPSCEMVENNSEKNSAVDISEEVELFSCSFSSHTLSDKIFLTGDHYKEYDLKNHFKNDNSRSQCEICDATFKRRCDMLRHLKNQHIHKKTSTKRRRRVDIEYTIFCDICKMGFTRKLDMKKHQSKKHADILLKYECSVEGDQTHDELKVNDGIVSEALAYCCELCNAVFPKKLDLNRHLKENHNQITHRVRRNKKEIIAQYFCDICGNGFTRKFDMQKHRRTKHPTEPISKEQSIDKQKKNQLLKRCKLPSNDNLSYYKCEVCSRIFRQSYNFMRHQTVHTGIRAYFCHICGKNFRVSGGLHRHITEHHYGVKKYECDVCGKCFAAKATRDDHRNIHTDDRPFICDVCGKAFRQKASLHIHKLFHTDNYRFICNVCGKKYRRATELKVHSWLHTGHKPHQCNMCESRFRLRQDLKRHLKIHNKLTECVCSECGSIFTQERYLKNHKKTHTLKNEEMTSTDITILPHL